MTAEPIPRYLEIADHLRHLVSISAPGDRLPSEAELCERFSVSRMTVRQAVQLLEHERLLVRRRGQGTFTAPRVVARLLGSPLSFTESMRRRGLRASSRMLHAGWIEPTVEDRAALSLPVGSRAIVVERLRLADDVPMAIERVVAPPTCAGILEADLAAGSLHLIFESLGRIPTRAQARVSARPATESERKLLGLGPHGVVLSERRTIDDQDGVPIEHTETLYAAERYEFEAVLQRGDDAVVR
jgi:GntR family transcriptional regulator